MTLRQEEFWKSHLETKSLGQMTDFIHTTLNTLGAKLLIVPHTVLLETKEEDENNFHQHHLSHKTFIILV